jgi:hypothetical protein
VNWGMAGDRVVAGDFDGDGKADFCVFRNNGGAGQFIMIPGTGSGASGTPVYTNWGLGTDTVAMGDYDGDGKADYAVTRNVSGNRVWMVRGSLGSNIIANWGLAGDSNAQGDYDGDGKTDFAVWRGGPGATDSGFWVNRTTGGVIFKSWGLATDSVTAAFLNN